MEQEEGAVVAGIRHIFRLKELLLKWQAVAAGQTGDADEAAASSTGTASETDGVRPKCAACDSDDENCRSLEPPPADVPEGHMAVYVGEEHRRFVIPTSYLGLPVFKILLEKVEEEFGFDNKGALTFPCETETFKYILQCMEWHQKGLIDDGEYFFD